MEQITIAEINRYNKTSKSTGKPFVSVAIKTSDGRSISGFGNKDNEHWQSGDVVEVDITQKGEYLNFTTPKGTFQKTSPSYQPTGDLLRVERKVDALLTELQMMRTVMGDILSRVDKDMEQPFP